jgi:hypothetical protein
LPGVLESVRLRRRLSRQRRLRDELLLDLGALVYELHRQGRRAPELLQEKAGELGEVDDDVRGLEAALDGREEPAPMPAAEATDEWTAGEEAVGEPAEPETEAERAEAPPGGGGTAPGEEPRR